MNRWGRALAPAGPWTPWCLGSRAADGKPAVQKLVRQELAWDSKGPALPRFRQAEQPVNVMCDGHGTAL